MPYVKGLRAAAPTAEGDGRGHFGIGRAAHGSDPHAVYVFEGLRTALPLEPTDQRPNAAPRFQYAIDVDEHQVTRIKVSGFLGDDCSQLKVTLPAGGQGIKTPEALEVDLLARLKRIVRDLQQRCDERLL